MTLLVYEVPFRSTWPHADWSSRVLTKLARLVCLFYYNIYNTNKLFKRLISDLYDFKTNKVTIWEFCINIYLIALKSELIDLCGIWHSVFTFPDEGLKILDESIKYFSVTAHLIKTGGIRSDHEEYENIKNMHLKALKYSQNQQKRKHYEKFYRVCIITMVTY